MSWRTNSNLTIVIMGVATLLAPFGVYFFSGGDPISVSIHAILWGIMPEGTGIGGVSFLNYIVVGRGLFYGVFNIWFGIEVVRHFSDSTRRRAATIAGVLSLLYPVIWAIIALPWLIAGSLVYLGPIPIQLIVGLIVMRYTGQPEIISAWDDDLPSRDT